MVERVRGPLCGFAATWCCALIAATEAKVDLHPEVDCRCWAGQGTCETNPAFMLTNCAASCEHAASRSRALEDVSQCRAQLQACRAECAASEVEKHAFEAENKELGSQRQQLEPQLEGRSAGEKCVSSGDEKRQQQWEELELALLRLEEKKAEVNAEQSALLLEKQQFDLQREEFALEKRDGSAGDKSRQLQLVELETLRDTIEAQSSRLDDEKKAFQVQMETSVAEYEAQKTQLDQARIGLQVARQELDGDLVDFHERKKEEKASDFLRHELNEQMKQLEVERAGLKLQSDAMHAQGIALGARTKRVQSVLREAQTLQIERQALEKQKEEVSDLHIALHLKELQSCKQELNAEHSRAKQYAFELHKNISHLAQQVEGCSCDSYSETGTLSLPASSSYQESVWEQVQALHRKALPHIERTHALAAAIVAATWDHSQPYIKDLVAAVDPYTQPHFTYLVGTMAIAAHEAPLQIENIFARANTENPAHIALLGIFCFISVSLVILFCLRLFFLWTYITKALLRCFCLRSLTCLCHCFFPCCHSKRGRQQASPKGQPIVLQAEAPGSFVEQLSTVSDADANNRPREHTESLRNRLEMPEQRYTIAPAVLLNPDADDRPKEQTRSVREEEELLENMNALVAAVPLDLAQAKAEQAELQNEVADSEAIELSARPALSTEKRGEGAVSKVRAMFETAEPATAAAWLQERRRFKSELEELKLLVKRSDSAFAEAEMVRRESEKLRLKVDELEAQALGPTVDALRRSGEGDTEQLMRAVDEANALRGDVKRLQEEGACQEARLREALDHSLEMADANARLSVQLETEVHKLRTCVTVPEATRVELERARLELDELRRENQRLEANSQNNKDSQGCRTPQRASPTASSVSEADVAQFRCATEEVATLREQVRGLQSQVAYKQMCLDNILSERKVLAVTNARAAEQLHHLHQLATSVQNALSDREDALMR